MSTATTDHYRLPYSAPPEIREVISGIGRTEDVKLSPGNDFLAIADVKNNHILILYIDVEKDPDVTVNISKYLILKSSQLNYPHGISFLDNRNLVVANRHGDVTAFEIPDYRQSNEVSVEPFFSITEDKNSKIRNPGSIDTYKLNDESYRLLVCNNHLHTITSHKLNIKKRNSIRQQGIVATRKLSIPDGLTISPDKRWIAVSNHVTGEILIYKNGIFNNRFTPPRASLKGIVCPHGIKFSPDGKSILVADAASPYLHVFKMAGAAWHDMPGPTKSLQLLSDDEFNEGRTNPEEGGLKGLDITLDGAILVTTCEVKPLAFYSMDIVDGAEKIDIQDNILRFCKERDEALELNIFAEKRGFPWQ